MKRLYILLIPFFCLACNGIDKGKESTETHHIKAGTAEESKPPTSTPDTNPNPNGDNGGNIHPQNPPNKSIEQPKPIENPQPVARCADVERCLAELEREQDETKRKAIIDALLPMFDNIKVVGSRGNQVGVYNQERGNLWLGLDKIGDSHYKIKKRNGREIELVLQTN